MRLVFALIELLTLFGIPFLIATGIVKIMFGVLGCPFSWIAVLILYIIMIFTMCIEGIFG